MQVDHIYNTQALYSNSTKINMLYLQNIFLFKLEFDKTLYIEEVRIYETYNCGGVKKVSCRSPAGQWVVIWEVPGPSWVQHSRIFTPPISVSIILHLTILCVHFC